MNLPQWFFQVFDFPVPDFLVGSGMFCFVITAIVSLCFWRSRF